MGTFIGKKQYSGFVFFLGIIASISMTGCGGGHEATTSSQPAAIVASADSLRAGEITQFKLEGKDIGSGTWSVSGGASNGQIDQNGLYHAPGVAPQPNSVSISYTSKGTSYTRTIQILNPTPILSSIIPNQFRSTVGVVSVSGDKFIKGAVVLVNGQTVPTTFVDSGHLQATVIVGTISPLSINVRNPDPGSSTSTALSVQASVQPVSISPSSLAGGNVNFTLTNIAFSSDYNATLDGRPLSLSPASDTTLSASGFLPPWHSGTAIIRFSSKETSNTLLEITVPITETAVSFDTAARFLTQAGFGPRPDLVQHIQQIGLEAFIDEQQSLPALPYSPQDSGVMTIMRRSVTGNNPLRMRVAWALQSFLVRSGIFLQSSNFPFEAKMEVDSTGNFRDLLTDVSSDVSIAMMLNLAGNVAPKDPSLHPNQNFARELLQLFTLGTSLLNDDGTIQTNPDGTPIPAYDQDTILDLSRVFTGWNYAKPVESRFTFYGVDWSAPLSADDSQHDMGEKRLFGNNVLPAGQGASRDRAMALDAIFAHPNLPPFVSRILIQRLVKSDPSPAYIKRISGVFKDNGHGVRGDLAATVKAILLDPEARAGDLSPTSSDGFLQEPYLFETFVMSITGETGTDDQPSYLPCSLNQCSFYSPTVFGFFSPSYRIPGTSINSPEFQILNDITIVNRSQALWAMLTGQQFVPSITKEIWLIKNSSSISDLIDAINHLAYHGQMPANEQSVISNYCDQLPTSDPLLKMQSAIFLALNADNYTVAH